MRNRLHVFLLAMMCLARFVLASADSGGGSRVTMGVVGRIRMIAIPGGSFLMGYDYVPDRGGDDRVNRYYPDEQPVHVVTVSPFLMSETEVTRRQYAAVMGEDPSSFPGGGDLPVTNVGADDALVFCNRLSESAGLEPCYDPETGRCDLSKNGFRLPTEAEWEYACRAGTRTHFCSGNTVSDLDRVGWYIGNSDGRVHSVALKEPNVWGLYDMHGNVWEFCYDGYDAARHFGNYPASDVTDPVGFEHFNYRIMRGGGWFSAPSECRSAVRGAFWTGGGSHYIGFRVVRSVR